MDLRVASYEDVN